jgi:serine kinase of HPr protein (carbohydrate metabolism regulator)
LALRLINDGARLVADDRVDVVAENGRLILSAPLAITGLMEVRGLGILRLEAVATVPLGLIVELVAPDEIERLPQTTTRRLLGADVPYLELAPFEASAPAKLRLALAVARGEIERVE